MSKVACHRRHRFNPTLSCLALFSILFATGMLLQGQGYFGTVSGEVSDASHALVPGVKVTLEDQQKGYHFSSTSDKSGRYLFTAVAPGTYSVSAEVAGFEKLVRNNVTVNVSENATANLNLKVATSKQSVDVQSEGRALATEDAVTGQVVNRRFINDLPLVDRYVLNFVGLAPGVNNMSDSNGVSDTGTNFASNGSRGASADICGRSQLWCYQLHDNRTTAVSVGHEVLLLNPDRWAFVLGSD